MKLSYNVTGQERKSLVGAVRQELNATTKYLGAPTFAYEVGGYHIDKVGTVVGMDGEELVGKLAAQGFTGEVEYDNLPLCEKETPAFGLDVHRSDPAGEDGRQASDVPEATESDRLTVEFPLEGFSPEAIDNLTKMVTAKEALIKAALGAEDISIKMTAEALRFPWFTLNDPSEAAYYVQFVFALCRTAKEKKRVTAKERDVENLKYAMRCWLLALGLIGGEYKNARKLLLANLGGNGSFKGGSRPTYTARLYTYPNGEEGESMECETFDFTSLAKAKAKCDEFAAECESIKYAGAHVEDDNGKYVYELLCD
ncbi:MAG: hypothetical protein LBO03_06880 [Acidaminococcales bacterium]|jgi:hypothetical protein|nr:hypothetical protein [Acidaminococcales bacterium]